MKAYSQDLRECILRTVDLGCPRSEIVQFFGVSLATIKRYIKQRREEGHVRPKTIPGRPPKKRAQVEAGVLPQLQAYDDASASATLCHVGANTRGTCEPVDLHETLSFPLPVLVICELLGVPFTDRERFRIWSTDIGDLYDRARASASNSSLTAYMRVLVERKRAQPEDDVLSGLCAVGNGALSTEQIAGLGAGLLFAGHETTVVRIDIGTLLFLMHPEQRQALLNDPALITTAVEEILRLSNTGSSGLPRYAREVIEIGGVTIQPCEAVLLSGGAANRDERVFGEPDSFAIERQPNPHLTFGYGSHFCIGAPLARIEL